MNDEVQGTFDSGEDYVAEPAEESAVVVEPVENPEESPEAQEETPTEEKKVTFTPEQQEVFNREISKKVAAQKEVERRADEYKAQLEEANKKLNPEPVRPDIPAAPDPYASDFQQQLEARDKAIQDAAAFDAQARWQSEQALATQQQQQAEQQKAQEAAFTSYVERGDNLGHDKAELNNATEYLMNVGLAPEAQVLIRDDAAGPDMAMYLAKNPEAMNQVLELQEKGNSVMVVAHLAAEIRAKASSSFRNDQLPPDPPDHLSGGGAKEGDIGPAGATYE